ncbi:flagellar biosynthetic protein FliO [Pseudomonas stutzeri]|uniref:Flagellar protein n=1 Tax=Stutzerimonas stutzeri KOS6 TaxID=1218352 RepID=A0A061JUX3_STUST|nr:flagellar biosynthetic protein FliO [Stutzerimonas stutzeri]EWC42074.1 flagellar assembly protein FliO [Stutzerimonas stutzeri KOS6]MBK3867797.1 flagellar biosynthetic protein FliO [Stutzerimonas stutzeri]
MRALAALAVTFMTLPALAAQPATSMSSADMGAQLSKLMLGLLLVIGLIFLLAWVLRRVQQMNPRGTQLIRIVSSQALGPRERLVLVQVGSEQILIGLSGGRITPLHVMQEPVHLPDGEPANPEFAQRLMELLGKDHKDRP